MPSDGKHRLQVALCIIKSVEQMHTTWARGGAAHPKTPCVLCIAHGGEGRGLFMPHLDELQLVLMRSQRLEEPVHSISGKAKHRINSIRSAVLL